VKIGLPRRLQRYAVTVALVAAAGRSAQARRGVRPLFEPTDLELEDAGVTEIDLQVGAVRSQGPWRVVVPDFELDVGVLRNLELDLDGAYAIEGPPAGPFAFDHPAPDSLWLSVKVGVWDWVDDGDGPGGAPPVSAWAVGLQAGPKLPVFAISHGLGVEGLILLGHAVHRTHLVLNAGAFLDPRPDDGSGRPLGIELGLDLDQEVDAAGHWSIKGEVGGVKFLSSDPNQLLVTLGPAWSPNDSLELSVIGMWGFLSGSDRYGVLLGFSPRIRFTKQK
jgi:hypothetical protein